MAQASFNFWSFAPKAGDYLTTMMAVIVDLKGRGLTGVHVAGDLVRCCLLPLKARKDPAWVNPAGHDLDQDSYYKSLPFFRVLL